MPQLIPFTLYSQWISFALLLIIWTYYLATYGIPNTKSNNISLILASSPTLTSRTNR